MPKPKGGIQSRNSLISGLFDIGKGMLGAIDIEGRA
jgi:hypothetical protein